MIKQQELYEAFLTRVEPEHRAFAAELHELFVTNGCTVEIKPTSSGFLVSYKLSLIHIFAALLALPLIWLPDYMSLLSFYIALWMMGCIAADTKLLLSLIHIFCRRCFYLL